MSGQISAEPRYKAAPLGGGWWAVFDSQTGREETFPETGDSMGSKADATALAAKLNAA